MKYIGLDLGTKTLGVAFSDSLGIFASAHSIIRHEDNLSFLVKEVGKLMQENQAEEIVLGFPKNMNNTIGERAERSLAFQKMLENDLGVKVHLIDERLSTKEATDLLIRNDTSRKKRKKVIDSMAATIILQSFLERRGK